MEKTKYIRGVPGRGSDILQGLKSKGVNCRQITSNNLSDSHFLYYIKNNVLIYAEDSSFISELLLAGGGEEMSVDDLVKYKFNVLDEVMIFLPALNIRKKTLIRERYYKDGVPYYKLRDRNYNGEFNLPEDQIFPIITSDEARQPLDDYDNDDNDLVITPKFNTGDVVKCRGVKGQNFILEVKTDRYPIEYDILKSNGEFATFPEDKLSLYDESKESEESSQTETEDKPIQPKYRFDISDRVICTCGPDRGERFIVIGRRCGSNGTIEYKLRPLFLEITKYACIIKEETCLSLCVPGNKSIEDILNTEPIILEPGDIVERAGFRDIYTVKEASFNNGEMICALEDQDGYIFYEYNEYLRKIPDDELEEVPGPIIRSANGSIIGRSTRLSKKPRN